MTGLEQVQIEDLHERLDALRRALEVALEALEGLRKRVVALEDSDSSMLRPVA